MRDVVTIDAGRDDVADVTVTPWVGLTVRAVQGDAMRRGRDGAPKPLRVGDVLAPGDAASVRGDVCALKLATDDGGTLTADGAVTLVVADYAGATVVLLRGALALEPPPMAREAIRVDTAGGRVATSSGRATVDVDDRGVRVAAYTAGTVAWGAQGRATRVTPRRPARWARDGVTPAALDATLAGASVDAGDAARDAVTATLSLQWGRLVARAPIDDSTGLAAVVPCDGCAALRARVAAWIDPP